MANTSHPCVVTIDHRSKPRTLFFGDQLMEVNLPVGTRVIYPKKPIAPLNDVKAAVRYALSHPLGDDPLYSKLRPGMKVTIAIDDLSMPLPPMKRPDIRQLQVECVLELLRDYAITDVELIIATAFHRPMTESDVRHMLGDEIVGEYWPDRLYNHDAGKPGGLTYLGTTEQGIDVEINARAAERATRGSVSSKCFRILYHAIRPISGDNSTAFARTKGSFESRSFKNGFRSF